MWNSRLVRSPSSSFRISVTPTITASVCNIKPTAFSFHPNAKPNSSKPILCFQRNFCVVSSSSSNSDAPKQQQQQQKEEPSPQHKSDERESNDTGEKKKKTVEEKAEEVYKQESEHAEWLIQKLLKKTPSGFYFFSYRARKKSRRKIQNFWVILALGFCLITLWSTLFSRFGYVLLWQVRLADKWGYLRHVWWEHLMWVVFEEAFDFWPDDPVIMKRIGVPMTHVAGSTRFAAGIFQRNPVITFPIVGPKARAIITIHICLDEILDCYYYRIVADFCDGTTYVVPVPDERAYLTKEYVKERTKSWTTHHSQPFGLDPRTQELDTP